MPTKRTDEFKRDAVSLVESDIAQKTVSRDPGISGSRDLEVRAAGVGAGREVPLARMTPSKDPDERRDVATAVRRIRQLEMENEVKVPAAVVCRVLGFSEQA